MSTIKSSAENLTLNADGANNDVIIQSNGSTKVTVDGATGNVDIAGAGKIGVEGGDSLYIQSGTTSGSGLHFHPSNGLTPLRNGARIDDAIDLGTASARFKDLYLSGGAYIGGTGAANKLGDYETGTWTVGLRGSDTAGSHTYHGRNGYYTKVGRAVHIQGGVHLNAINTMSGTIYVTGLPFTAGFSGGAINFSYAGAMSITAGTVPIGYAVASGTEFVIYAWDVTSGTTALNQSEIGNGTQIIFSGTYFI